MSTLNTVNSYGLLNCGCGVLFCKCVRGRCAYVTGDVIDNNKRGVHIGEDSSRAQWRRLACSVWVINAWRRLTALVRPHSAQIVCSQPMQLQRSRRYISSLSTAARLCALSHVCWLFQPHWPVFEYSAVSPITNQGQIWRTGADASLRLLAKFS